MNFGSCLSKAMCGLTKVIVIMHSPNDDLMPPSDSQDIRRDILLKTQQAILARVLPALHLAIEDVTNFMYEPDGDDEEIHGHLRELATETIIDETVRLLTRDLTRVSKQYMIHDVDGIGIDTLIACYGELLPENARAWFAHELDMDDASYLQLASSLPDHM